MLAGAPSRRITPSNCASSAPNIRSTGRWIFFPSSIKKLARFFQLNHVCVFPSLHPEAFGIVAAEAMASGLALVGTGVGGASEVFEDGISGLHYPAGDSTA